MLYDYLLTHYNPNEPIFIEDITLSNTRTDLLQKLKALCDTGKIKIFSNGVYYIPKESMLKNGRALSPTTVITHKYIKRSGKIIGYYASHTLANQIGITTQVPYVTEIVTNNTATECRKETLCGQEFIVRKARCPITNNKYYILQLLDLLNDLDIITVGNIHILAILTPGHTVGSMCYLTNHTLFTGDTIFNEGCGMCFGQGADPKSMFQTIQRLKSEIPDSVMVYAGHCFSREVGELFGFLKQNNVYFLIENEKEFIDFRMRSGQKHLFSFN